MERTDIVSDTNTKESSSPLRNSSAKNSELTSSGRSALTASGKLRKDKKLSRENAQKTMNGYSDKTGELELVVKTVGIKKYKKRHATLCRSHLYLFCVNTGKLKEDIELEYRKVEAGKKTSLKISRNTADAEVEFTLRAPNEELQNWIAAIQNNINVHRNSATESMSEIMTVFVGSWNVGNSCPPDNLSPWITGGAYDIVVVGAQECSYQRTGTNASDWFERVTRQLGPDFVEIARDSLLEIRLIIFVRKEHATKVSKVMKTTEATGLAHVVGNKGVVGVSFNIHSTSLCFINSHFAAHQKKVQGRNNNYYEVCQELTLGEKTLDITNQFNHLFWFGDLNYRIDLPREKVIQLIEAKDYAALYKEDQLRKEMEKEAVFQGFCTKPPSFPPTYRYLRDTLKDGKRVYNDEKQRIPAWCDRILWKSFPNSEITLLDWNCCDSIITSDHSPVYASFQLLTYLLPHSNSQKQQAYIIFSELAGRGLCAADSNGFSDHEKHRTSHIEKTLNPVWDKEFKIPCKINNTDYLSRQCVILELMDYDRVSKDDPLGQAVVSLYGAYDSEPIEFNEKIMLNGKLSGTVTGKVQIILQHP